MTRIKEILRSINSLCRLSLLTYSSPMVVLHLELKQPKKGNRLCKVEDEEDNDLLIIDVEVDW